MIYVGKHSRNLQQGKHQGMAYNSKNKHRQYLRIIEIYKAHKQEDIPDTFIVSKIFPKHNIFISYRTWNNIKGMKPSDLRAKDNQLSLF